MTTSIHPRRQLLAGLVLAVALASAITPPVLAYDENSSAAINVDASGLALKGYDPVAYFSLSTPTPGQARYTATHEGATYRFASEANRARFVADPAKYAPAFGGFCAMGVALEKKLDVDPSLWRIVDGRLYLNVHAGAQKRWLEDVPGNLATAEKTWPRLKNLVPKTL